MHARVHQECTKTSASRPRLVPHSGALYAFFLYPLSMHFVQGVLKIGNDSNYRAVPKHRSRGIFPVRARWIQNRFVPKEPFLNTAIRFRLRRSSACTILQFQRHDMPRVPKLACQRNGEFSSGFDKRRARLRLVPSHNRTLLRDSYSPDPMRPRVATPRGPSTRIPQASALAI